MGPIGSIVGPIIDGIMGPVDSIVGPIIDGIMGPIGSTWALSIASWALL